MAWQEEIVTILRVLVNDQDSTLYTDAKLESTILVAAFQVNQEPLVFQHEFSVNVTLESITPDPTDSTSETRDESYINLVSLKAACIIDRGAAILAANRAIAVRDGSSSIDLRGVFQGKLAMLEKGWCAVYQDAKLEYQAGSVRIAGAAVMTPFRLYAWGGGDPFSRESRLIGFN